MRILAVLSVAVTLGMAAQVGAQSKPRPPLAKGHKMRIKVDSAPQQAAVYVDSKEYGIEGYTPTTLKLPKGDYLIIVEAPGFRPVERRVRVTRSEGFIFTLERQARPAVLDVRSTSDDSATGGQLYVDGAQLGKVPARIEVAAGSHLIEVKKPGFKDYRDNATVQEGETRSMVIDLQGEQKKGAILVTADVAGADVYVDGTKRDAAPCLIGDLVEGAHTIEVRKDPMPPFKQVVQVIGNQQVKVEARIAANMPQQGSIRVVSSTPGAEVLVDGEPKGPANSEIGGLRPGQHIVEVRAKGFTPQVVESVVTAGEQRIARIDLKPVDDKTGTARLRVVTPVPDAEVFIDGSSVGKAPIDRNDLAAGKHFVTVRKSGYAEWKREVNLEGGGATTLTAELSASGTVKVLSNVAGADVYVDGSPVGRTPVTLDNVAAGEHLIEVKKSGYLDAKQPFRVDGGEQKILSADLVQIRTGPSMADMTKTLRGMSSFSAVTIEPGKFTFDIGGGFLPFVQARLTVGAFRRRLLGLDAGVHVESNIYYTTGGVHAKLQFLRAGPFAMGTQIALGGGGGPVQRSTFEFAFGLPMTLLFGDLVRVTANPQGQVYTDRNCPDVSLPEEEKVTCAASSVAGQNPRERYVGFRLLLQFALEIAVHQVATIFFIAEGDPIGQRQSLTKKFSAFYAWDADPQIYGRMGVSFKF